jgi:hypothetical protein
MRRSKKKVIWCISLSLVTALVISVFSTGCATVIHGRQQRVRIDSKPKNATVTINSLSFGKTPVVAKLDRKVKKYEIVIELEGYKPYLTAMDRKFSGWVLGNIVWAGVGMPIGVAVDAITGGMWKLEPDKVRAELTKQGAKLEYDENKEDILIIAVVMEADPSWEKIGNLIPIE